MLDAKSVDFPADFSDLRALHAGHRVSTHEENDLWRIDQVEAGSAFQHQMPIFSPAKWPPHARLSMDDYRTELHRRHPYVQKVLDKCGGRVVLAGGAAASPFYEKDKAAGDVDLFIVGVNPSNQKALWKVATLAARVAHEEMKSQGATWGTTHIERGLITLTATKRSDRAKCQIILRAYPSVSSLLHSFDIPSCMVAYDGKVAVTTSLGAYALSKRVNVVLPEYRSPSYEHRLAKYFNRGFALGLPGLDASDLIKEPVLSLAHLDLIVASGECGWATGSIRVGSGPDVKFSDYEATCSLCNVDLLESVHSDGPVKLDMVLGGRWWVGDWDMPRPSDRPCLGDFLTKKNAELIVKRFFRTHDIQSLVRILGMSTKQFSAFHRASVSPGRIPVRDLLKNFTQRLYDRIEARSDEAVDLWVANAPDRKFTASREPASETPDEWYGRHFQPDVNNGVYSRVWDIHHHHRSGGMIQGGCVSETCAICLEIVMPGQANTIRLNCGHSFHWTRSRENACEGLGKWIKKKRECPMCRRNVYLPLPRQLTVVRPISPLSVEEE